MANEKENQAVFALGTDETKCPVLIIGISKAAYEYIKDGKTHTFDLTKIGFPMKAMVFGADTRQDCLDLIEQSNQLTGAMQDISDKNMGIDEPTKQ